MKKLIYSQEDLNLILSLETQEKDEEIERLNKLLDETRQSELNKEYIINELEEYLSRFLYMLNGILDRDIYEQCQLEDFTQIMEKLKELKENK